ncbi:MAG: hypothetical protein AAF352_00905 [Pseudomonadota bacterium]
MRKKLQLTDLPPMPPRIVTEDQSIPAEKIFQAIVEQGIWDSKNEGSPCGSGSSMKHSQNHRNALKGFFDVNPKLRVFDAPCGDMHWMQHLLREIDISYCGGDIIGDMVAQNRQKFPHLPFLHFDCRYDAFPKADIWHCRHCLFHLSLRDIRMALVNFCASQIDYAMISNHFLPEGRHRDIQTGHFRILDLQRAPFGLPDPLQWFCDCEEDVTIPLYTGLWTREQITKALLA